MTMLPPPGLSAWAAVVRNGDGSNATRADMDVGSDALWMPGTGQTGPVAGPPS
ncbi:MAG: hypothetical protein JWP89_3819 [Schlesneria sp.]|nr:hypothetical protein [Schlesneria sp.]